LTSWQRGAGPCRSSVPILKSLWKKYSGSIVIITIAVDPSHDNVERLREWVKNHNATWIHARDTAEPRVSKLYKVSAIPTFILIDKEGKVRFRHVGLTAENVLSNEISTLLRE